MAVRKEKNIYEGPDRRQEERRRAERRKSEKIMKILKYLAIILLAVAILKFFRW